jgi:hypothetical protein
MERSNAQYRKFAEECRRLAQSAKTAEERRILQEMEAAWTSLAQAAESRKT